MNIKLPLITASTLVALAASASSAVLASWSFEAVPASPSTTVGPYAADAGVAAASSNFTTNNTTGLSTPAGNGSTKSYSANGWAVGEYYQFTTNTTGYTDITISFDATGSNTGPRDFALQYSTNGTTFTNFTTYSLVNNGWSAGTPNLASTKTFDLSAVSAIEGAATVYFRITVNSTTAITGGTVAAAGTSRVDNFTISAVPEPQAAALLGAVGMLGLVRRRR